LDNEKALTPRIEAIGGIIPMSKEFKPKPERVSEILKELKYA
jgi:hypothetical protein